MIRPELEELVQHVAMVKRDDPMAPVTVIVPSDAAGRSVGWRLAAGVGDGPPAIAGVRITTLARLAESVAAVRLHPRRPLLSAVLAAAWRGELARHANDRGWLLRGVWDHPATVSAMVRSYRDLREVPPSAWPDLDPSSVAGEALRLSRRVRDALRGQWYDQQDLYAEAVDLCRDAPAVFEEFGTLLMFLPGEEGPSANRFLEALGEAHPLVLVQPGPARVPTRVLHASDSDDEVRCIVREVVAALAVPGQRAHRLAIVHPSPRPYARLLHAHLNAAGVAFNGRGGTPVVESSIARAFLGTLGLAGHGFPRSAVFDILYTWRCRQFDGSAVPAVTWERTSRAANIVGGLDPISDWGLRLDTFTAQAEERETTVTGWRRDRIREEREAAHALRGFIVELAARLHDIHIAPTWREVVERSLALLSDVFGEVGEAASGHSEEHRAHATVRAVLTDLVALDAHHPPSGLSTLVDVLVTELGQPTPRVGTFGSGVFVGDLAQARGMDLDRIWIVGLSEDAYPGRGHEDALLPDWLRQDTPGLQSYRDRVARKCRDLDAAFAAATHVTASFPRGDLRRSTERLPSRLLLPTLRGILGRPDLSATTWKEVPAVEGIVDCASFAHGVTTTPFPATVQEWQVRNVAAGGTIEDAAHASALEMNEARSGDRFTRFDGNLSGVEGLPNYAHEGFEISPTRLEGYAVCPFAFFVHRLLGAQPIEEPASTGPISAIELGNIFHNTMDGFIQQEKAAGTLPGPAEPWTELHEKRLFAAARTAIAGHRAKGLIGHPTLWEFQEERVMAEFRAMLHFDTEWRAANRSRPVDSELAFGGTHPHPAVEVEVPAGVVRFTGSADKVDVSDGAVFVTDIKSGSARRFKDIGASRNHEDESASWTVGGTKLQLPIYAKAAREAFGLEASEARYWFVHGASAGTEVNLPLTPDVEASFAEDVGVLVDHIARGHFIAKPSRDPGFLWVDCDYCTPHGQGHAIARDAYEDKRLAPELLELLMLIDPDGAAALVKRMSELERAAT